MIKKTITANRKNPYLCAMKKLAILLSICYFFVSSCSNDFELTDDWKDIAVVYGLLNPSDTAHYVKVGKAFLDQETSSLVVAQIADSLYYKDVSVELKELSASGDVDNTIQMSLVDGNMEGFPKPEGVFAASPNYIYKTKDVLNPAKTYRIEILNGENSSLVTGETPLIPNFNVTRPRSVINSPSSRMRWTPGAVTSFRWQLPEGASFFDLTMEVVIEEAENNGMPVVRTLTWELEKNIIPNNSNVSGTSMNLGYDGEELYQFLAASLTEGQFCRKLIQFNVKVDAGGESLYQYINAGQANTGITSTLPLPNYTNLSGDSRGIFSTRATTYENLVKADGSVFDELMTNPLTSGMGFVSEISTCN